MAAHAPGRLDEVRAFLNTFDFESTGDPLVGPDNLPAWSQTDREGEPLDEGEMAKLRAFREALRPVIEAHSHGSPDEEAAAWTRLQPFLADTGFKVQIVDGRPMLRGEGAGAHARIGRLLAIVYDAIGDGTWRRLKACGKSSCRYAFYDRSKNGSGTWCDMAVCGNRAKAQRRRTRQKSSKIR